MRPRATWLWEATLAAAALLGAYLWAGQPGVIGMALGILVPAFSILAMWGAIRTLGSAAPSGASGVPSGGRPPTQRGSGCLVLLFLLKAPVLGVGVYYATRLGEGTLACFLVGVGLVYSSLVLRVSLDAREQDRSQR